MDFFYVPNFCVKRNQYQGNQQQNNNMQRQQQNYQQQQNMQQQQYELNFSIAHYYEKS